MNGWVSGPAIDDSPTKAPPPARAIAAPLCFSVKKAPLRLMSITRSHSATGMATTGAIVPVPADATQCWRPPVMAEAAATAAATSSSLATSHAIPRTSVPAGASALSSATAASRRSWLRPAMVTDAPSRNRWRAAARPIPLPPPVISAAVPASTSSAMSSPWSRWSGQP